MKQNFQVCLADTLKYEGGYGDNPKDPGGPTNFGITLADYRSYIKKNGTATDVKNMTQAQAATIYKAQYWDKMGCDALPSGVDMTVFDYGVNSGVSRSLSTYKKYASLKDPVQTINKINDDRLAFLHGLSTWSTFGKGWASRVSSVRANSIKLASNKAGVVGAATAGAVVTGGTALATTPHSYWPWIIGGIAVVLVGSTIYYLIHEFRKSNAS